MGQDPMLKRMMSLKSKVYTQSPQKSITKADNAMIDEQPFKQDRRTNRFSQLRTFLQKMKY